MTIYNTYIQQLDFNGTTYTKGGVVDLLETYKIICQEFPFNKNPKPKELPTRDWAGEDGVDVYVCVCLIRNIFMKLMRQKLLKCSIMQLNME